MESSKERGERIKDARIAKGFKNQAQLAVKLNMSVNTLSALESGRKVNTRTSILQLIGKELNIKFEI
jgi:transcriptional regulator with XRE-family HTH domain